MGAATRPCPPAKVGNFVFGVVFAEDLTPCRLAGLKPPSCLLEGLLHCRKDLSYLANSKCRMSHIQQVLRATSAGLTYDCLLYPAPKPCPSPIPIGLLPVGSKRPKKQ